MLFNEPIHNWIEWGAIFQSTKAFTPLAKEIFRREGLAFSELNNLTPGTNAVFRAGDHVVKIFAPASLAQNRTLIQQYLGLGTPNGKGMTFQELAIWMFLNS